MATGFEDAVALVKSGDLTTARTLMARELVSNPLNESAWLWMAVIVDSDDKRRECLEQVLVLNPYHSQAKRSLAMLRQKQSPRYKIIQTICDGLDEVDRFETLADGFKLAWPDPIQPIEPTKVKQDSIWQTVKTIYVTYNPLAHQKVYAKEKPKNNSTPRFPGQPFQLKPLEDRDAVVSIFYENLDAELLDEMDSRTQELLEKLAKSVKPQTGRNKWMFAALAVGLLVLVAAVALIVMILL